MSTLETVVLPAPLQQFGSRQTPNHTQVCPVLSPAILCMIKQQCNLIMISDIATLPEPILELIHFSSECMHNTFRRMEVLIPLLQQILTNYIQQLE